MSHGNVTRDVTGGVTAPRPDPTRPTVVTAVCGVSGSNQIQSNGYLPTLDLR